MNFFINAGCFLGSVVLSIATARLVYRLSRSRALCFVPAVLAALVATGLVGLWELWLCEKNNSSKEMLIVYIKFQVAVGFLGSLLGFLLFYFRSKARERKRRRLESTLENSK